jgi:hypothetical protein
MPSFSVTSVKTYAKTGIGCLVFQHKREDIPQSSVLRIIRHDGEIRGLRVPADVQIVREIVEEP